jgi:hypothetical protein
MLIKYAVTAFFFFACDFFIWLSMPSAGDEREEWEKHLTPEEAKRNGTVAGPLIAPREESLKVDDSINDSLEIAAE